MTEIMSLGDIGAPVHLLLAPGAGASMTSPFLETMAALIAERGVRVSRFSFAYLSPRASATRRPPPRAETLVPEFQRAIERVLASTPPGRKLLIGGKSMGGRIASMMADEQFAAGRIAGLVCLGYPFHPTGKPEQTRTAHLAALKCPALVVQGERDPFGSRAEVETYTLSPAIRLQWIGDGDHDFGPRGGSGFTRKGNLAAAADAIASFAGDLDRAPDRPA